MRIGAAAAPRWWGVEPSGLPDYLAHLAASGATSVEFIVHHGPAIRDPSTVHLDRSVWRPAVAEATRRGLHVDVHNSLDPRFRLDRWAVDRHGLQNDLRPIVDLLAALSERQADPPAFVVHAADRCSEADAVTADALAWLATELDLRRCGAVPCVELRSKVGPDDDRFDRNWDHLVAFVETQANSTIGVCWDLANEWLSAVRSGRNLTLPEAIPSCVRHVHLHGSTEAGLLHAPLGAGNVPWQSAMELLLRERWCGSATLEIRYRLAHDLGEPWTVLADSFRQALSVRI